MHRLECREDDVVCREHGVHGGMNEPSHAVLVGDESGVRVFV
jgi:hypothetical protein